MNQQHTHRDGPPLKSLLRVLRDLVRPRYRAQIQSTPKLTPIADILARAGREPLPPA